MFILGLLIGIVCTQFGYLINGMKGFVYGIFLAVLLIGSIAFLFPEA